MVSVSEKRNFLPSFLDWLVAPDVKREPCGERVGGGEGGANYANGDNFTSSRSGKAFREFYFLREAGPPTMARELRRRLVRVGSGTPRIYIRAEADLEHFGNGK